MQPDVSNVKLSLWEWILVFTGNAPSLPGDLSKGCSGGECAWDDDDDGIGAGHTTLYNPSTGAPMLEDSAMDVTGHSFGDGGMFGDDW